MEGNVGEIGAKVDGTVEDCFCTGGSAPGSEGGVLELNRGTEVDVLSVGLSKTEVLLVSRDVVLSGEDEFTLLVILDVVALPGVGTGSDELF